MNKKKRFLSSLRVWLLIVAILLQTLSLSISASGLSDLDLSDWFKKPESPATDSVRFDRGEVIAQLRKDFLKSINQDLLYKVEDYQLTGEVGVILSFSENSLITSYVNDRTDMTYPEYRDTLRAADLKARLRANQNSVISELQSRGLISEVKYHYYHILDGVYVTTTFEQLDAICNTAGIERVLIANTYNPAEAVENQVNTYDTGIFNSSDVSYTGKGTIVAILDTGCDYTHTAFTTHEVISPLYSRDDIEKLLPGTVAYSYDSSLEAREVYYGNLTGNKIAFGYDYADRDPDVMPFDQSHGTHVAGIIGGMDSTITGVAVDAQLAIMKVFSDYRQGANDGDILAALEDSVVLGVDAINMSLGTSCGFTREVDEEYKNTVYDKIEEAGISLIVAASNDYSSGYGSEAGNTNKTDNPDSATVGAPSTYNAAFSVASINGNKDKYMVANGSYEVFFHEAVNQSAKEYNFFEQLGVTAGSQKQYEYVTIPGFGMAINYSGLDVRGKIALVRRGDISFEEKVQFASEAGAAAIIVYNNVFGDIIMTVGNNAKIPVISIGKDDGELLAKQETGTITFDLNNQAGPFMSDFSSWGPNPDLKLKPEITAHGGNILSSVPGGGYEKISGTSMASPNMCGIVVLIRQYVKENYPELTAPQVRDLVNQLCMSTATIALDRKGNPYSPRKQGAGIADIVKATTTPAYLSVEGIGKTKLELGDDAKRTGVYDMSIQLTNLSSSPVSYRVGSIVMTESLSTSDPKYVAEMAYLLSNSAEYTVQNGSFENGVVTVAPGQTATVSAKVTLSAADKSYLNANFANGMFVEGYLTFESTDANGVDLNAPFLAFYGDWSEAPIFDKDYYEVETEAHNKAIDDDDKIKADYYATTPLGKYYYDYMIPLGSYVYKINEEEYTPIPATAEHAAVSYYYDSISGIYAVFAGLLRGAKTMEIQIVNTATGEVVWSDTQYNCYKAHYTSAANPYVSSFNLDMVNLETSEVFGDNNAHYEVTMKATLDWDSGNRNSSDTYKFSFYIDYQAPILTGAEFRTEYDKNLKKNRYYVDLTVYDNHYAMSLRPIICYNRVDDNGETVKTYSSLSEYAIPIYQTNRGEESLVTVEITNYIDQIKQSDMPEGITFVIDDYAMNTNICYVPFPETESDDLEFQSRSLDLKINETFDLTTYFEHLDSEDEVVTDYLQTLTWTSSNPTVVAVHDGKIEALASGSAIISVRMGEQNHRVTKNISIRVGEESVENPDSRFETQIEKLEFISYKTLFAFNGDIDYSEIGSTNSINYFDGGSNISFYPSEKVQLYYNLEPWNLDPSRYTLSWSSSNPKVATVDENGVVTAEAEGRCRIVLQITIDGKTSILAARCSIEVKSEFIIENRQLVAYKGKGGEVVIPDDEGIMTIGAFAFCHYNLDNTKEVEKDEDGSYDFDLKKEPLGNNTVTSVVIPEGVETIDKYAFYNCKLLKKVTLPESCKNIGAYAFYQNKVLEDVNFDRVKVIANYAFYQCEKLNCTALGGINLSGVNAIGDGAFAGCLQLTSVSLDDLRRSGVGAFANCTQLSRVVLGKRARLADRVFENTAIENIVIWSDTIPDSAFKGCTGLRTVEIRTDLLTYLGKEAFSGCTALNSIRFEGICEQISDQAFRNCTSLTELTLPNCNLVLGHNVFENSALNTLIFGTDTYIVSTGTGLFQDVANVTLRADSSKHYQVISGALYSKDGTRLVLAQPGAALGDFVVPATVKEICDGAFASNSSLTSLSFAEGSQLERIGFGAFSYCNKLAAVTLPANAITVDDAAFFAAVSLKSVNLDHVVSVGEQAFADTALTGVELRADNVKVGVGAFYGCNNLKNVTLGAGAYLAFSAFRETPVVTVAILGDGVVIDDYAFYQCTRLASFDFEKVTGKIGDLAFYQCRSLTDVHMPHVTELGEGSFADCLNLVHFKAEKLETVGVGAFAAYSENSAHGANFATVELPSLKTVGQGAFYGCLELTEIDLSGVTSLASEAFANCTSLRRVILSKDLKEVPEYVFYSCTALSEINLENVVRIGDRAFYGARRPAHLELTNAEYIGEMAFVEENQRSAHYLRSVNAPKLTEIGDQAFALCENLTEIHTPVLERIGIGAFLYCSMEEFEVPSTLKEIGFSAFDSAGNFKAFYATVNGEKLYNHEFDHVMIQNGVLYTVADTGYVLVSYPYAKQDAELTVADGTVRIDYRAALGNASLTKVILPESLRYIGDYAFYECSKLKTVEFHSYYAPVLEGTMVNTQVELTPGTVRNYPGFDKLYRYDFYYRTVDEVAVPLLYCNFVDIVTSRNATGLICIIPDECEGYDSAIYRAYFTPSEQTSGKTTEKFALAFIDAARKLPAVADRFDKTLIEAAITAYNALEGHPEEMADVSEDLINRFRQARVEYNVSVMENQINHLFDMDCSAYSYNLVKNATAAFRALTDEERALVSNADVLTQKTAELSAAMGKELDFSLSFEDYFKEPGTDDPQPPVDPITDGKKPMQPWAIALIVTVSVLALAGAAVGGFILVKKKRTAE